MTVDVAGEKEETTGYGTDKNCDNTSNLCVIKKGKFMKFPFRKAYQISDNPLHIVDEARVQIEGTVKTNAQRLEFRDDGNLASAGAENTLFKRGDTGTLTETIADKASYKCAKYGLFFP